MNIQKNKELRAAYDKGRHARMYGDAYKKGRAQGRSDMKSEIINHLSGRHQIKWLNDLLYVRETPNGN